MAGLSIARVQLKELLLILEEKHLLFGSGQTKHNAKAIAGKQDAFMVVKPDKFLLGKKMSREQDRKLLLGMGTLLQGMTTTKALQGTLTSLHKLQPPIFRDVRT